MKALRKPRPAATDADASAARTRRDRYAGEHLKIGEMIERWREAQAGSTKAHEQLSTAERLAFGLHPEIPTILREPGRPTVAISRDRAASLDCRERQLTWPMPETHSPRVQAWDRWRAQCDAIDAAFGLPRLERAADDADFAAADIARLINTRPPSNSAEAAAKMSVLLSLHGEGADGLEDPIARAQFLADLNDLVTDLCDLLERSAPTKLT